MAMKEERYTEHSKDIACANPLKAATRQAHAAGQMTYAVKREQNGAARVHLFFFRNNFFGPFPQATLTDKRASETRPTVCGPVCGWRDKQGGYQHARVKYVHLSYIHDQHV
jgi:hypothetical protein